MKISSSDFGSADVADECGDVLSLPLDLHIGSSLLTNFYRSYKFNKLNSNIILNTEISNELIYHTKHNSKIIPTPQSLYRGSRDGFKDDDFHSRCDNQGPTLTIIKSAEPYNQVFGGFTTKSWKSSTNGGEYISDSSSFIFKIDDENSSQQFRKFNLKQDKKRYAILDIKYFLPIFGSYDICIFSDCNLNKDSCTNFGATYELPPSNDEDEHKKGSFFTVSEIEVFKIITTSIQ